MQNDKNRIKKLLTQTADVWFVSDYLKVEPEIVADIADELIADAKEDTDVVGMCAFILAVAKEAHCMPYSVLEQLGEEEIRKIYAYWDEMMTMKFSSIDLSISYYVSAKGIEATEKAFKLAFPLFKTAKLWNYAIQQTGEKDPVKGLYKVSKGIRVQGQGTRD